MTETVSTNAAEVGTSPTELLADHARSAIGRLQRSLLDRNHFEHSRTVAQMARLRRAGIDDPGDPAVWEVVYQGMPPNLLGSTDEPGRAERALHATLVLYAIHAQSADGPRHARGRRLGLAMGDLARADNSAAYASSPSARRFAAFATATTWPQSLSRLQGLVSLLRSHSIALDYGSLAADLYWMQTPEGLRRARLRWGRDFHHIPPVTPTSEEN